MKPLILFSLAIFAVMLSLSSANADAIVHGRNGTAVHTGRGTVVHGHNGTVAHTNRNWNDSYWHGNKYGYWNGHRGYWHVVNGEHIFVVVVP